MTNAAIKDQVIKDPVIKDAFERNERALTARPSLGEKSGHVTVRAAEGLRCEVKSGPWRFAVDMPEKVGGTETAPTPGVYEASALGSCIAIMARLWAAKYDVPIGAIEVQVEFEADLRWLFGVGDLPARWKSIRYRVRVESDAPKEDILRVLDAAHRQSHVRGDFEHAFEVEREVEIVGA